MDSRTASLKEIPRLNKNKASRYCRRSGALLGGGLARMIQPGRAQKKQRSPSVLLFRASQASRPGFRLAPRVVSLHPRWVANCYLCRLFATLSYLSTLPSVSPPLPSAVGYASVPVGSGNITKPAGVVNPFFKKITHSSWRNPDYPATRTPKSPCRLAF